MNTCTLCVFISRWFVSANLSCIYVFETVINTWTGGYLCMCDCHKHMDMGAVCMCLVVISRGLSYVVTVGLCNVYSSWALNRMH